MNPDYFKLLLKYLTETPVRTMIDVDSMGVLQVKIPLEDALNNTNLFNLIPPRTLLDDPLLLFTIIKLLTLTVPPPIQYKFVPSVHNCPVGIKFPPSSFICQT